MQGKGGLFGFCITPQPFVVPPGSLADGCERRGSRRQQVGGRGCREQEQPGDLSAAASLCSMQSLTAVSQRGRLAGSEHRARLTREFSGPEEQKRGADAPGRVERPVRHGSNSTQLREASLCCVTGRIAQLL